MKAILNALIMDHKGPWKDYSLKTRQEYANICKTVAAEIMFNIIGVYPDGCDGVSVEYDFYEEIWLYVTFSDRATHTAEQIATAFQEVAEVAVNVKVWECVSEHTSK